MSCRNVSDISSGESPRSILLGTLLTGHLSCRAQAKQLDDERYTMAVASLSFTPFSIQEVEHTLDIAS